MYSFSLIDKFKSLDIYRKLPSDYVQPTYSGAMRNYNNNFNINYIILIIYSIFNKFNNNGFTIFK